MTDEQIKEARELCEKATDGPWQTRFIYRLFSDARQNPKLMMQGDGSTDWKDSDFIAQARTLLPAALDEIERLRWLKKKRYVVGADPRREGRFIVRDAFSTWPDCIVAEGATEEEAIDNAMASKVSV